MKCEARSEDSISRKLPRTLPYAIALSRQFQAELSCLHVIDEANEEFLRSKCIPPLVAAPYAMEMAIYGTTEQQFREFIQTPSPRGGEPED